MAWSSTSIFAGRRHDVLGAASAADWERELRSALTASLAAATARLALCCAGGAVGFVRRRRGRVGVARPTKNGIGGGIGGGGSRAHTGQW
jgi:hypothetical protein